MKTAVFVSVFTLLAVSAPGQQAGDLFAGLTPEQRAAFDDGKEAFQEEERTRDGLGPVFNGTSCAECHFNPAVGGDSNIVETRFGTTDKNKFDALGDLGGSLDSISGDWPRRRMYGSVCGGGGPTGSNNSYWAEDHAPLWPGAGGCGAR